MPAGRPTEFSLENLEIAATCALNGATDDEIADEIGVSVRTVSRWYVRYPEFRQAVRYGKEQADERVERSLFHRAVGFERDAVKISFDKEGNPLYATYREYFAPEPGALKLWLSNRQPDKWREKVPGESADNPLYVHSSIPDRKVT